MALYEYRCGVHGVFEVMRPIGTAPDAVPCAQCGESAPRALSAPRVLTGRHAAWSAAMDHAHKSRYEPEVVTALPPAAPVRRPGGGSLTPAMRHLPRP